MIFLDSSVALAHLLAEDRFPPDLLWEQQLVSSRAARAALQSLLWDMMFPEIRSDP